jgi:hypothetical protein
VHGSRPIRTMVTWSFGSGVVQRRKRQESLMGRWFPFGLKDNIWTEGETERGEKKDGIGEKRSRTKEESFATHFQK